MEIALRLLHRHGLAAVTMRRVAGELGLGTMTLYTYVEGQQGLYRAMVSYGFEMLHQACRDASTLETEQSWRGGARSYLRFAVENPNLYRLMFENPTIRSEPQLLAGGFQPLLDKVTAQLAAKGISGSELSREARRAAGRYWIPLHGLAMLAIAGRLGVLETSADLLLEDLLQRVAPS